MELGGALGISSKHLDPGSVFDALLHPFGGESVAAWAFPSFCMAQAKGDIPREPATLASVVATLFCSEALKRGGKGAGQECLGVDCQAGRYRPW